LLVVGKLLGTGEQLGLALQRLLAADAVDGPVPRDRHEPTGRVRRRALARPSLDRRRERILKDVLGEVEVAEDADQGREHARALVAEDLLDQRSTSGRTSTEPPMRA